jgi:hypothetical protein
MGISKNTQGKWYVNEQFKTTVYSDINGFTKIADVNDFKKCASIELLIEAEANAKLISAAPDLLDENVDSQIMLWLLCHTEASVCKTSLYDNEDVEGWKWEYNGKEFYEVGSWLENPVLPKDLRQIVIESTDSWKSDAIKKAV